MTHPTTHDWIERLVRFDTTSRNSNLDLIQCIADYLSALGLRPELTYNAERTKANLFATVGDGDLPGVVLSGHTDVVPVDGQDWHSDPWRVIARDDKIFGRGVCDMKSFVAVCLAQAPDMVARKLKQPLHFAFSYDEEIGCVGVRGLIAELAAREVKPVGCIVGEPTSMRTVNGHKGKLSQRCRVRGLACHSGTPHLGANAVEAAAEGVAFLKRMARRLRDEGPHNKGYEPTHTTVHTGVISGGVTLNIVPEECFFDFEFRYVPGSDARDLFTELRAFMESEVLTEMRAVYPDSAVTFEELSRFPGLDTDAGHAIARLSLQLGGGGDEAGKVSFGTEAGLFSEIGVPSVVCGPGSINQAHKPDEFITLQQIAQCEKFITGVTDAATRADD